MDNVSFQEYVSTALANLPSIEAVLLGGSRARGRNTEESEWDFAIYYRNGFQPDDLRQLGWNGVVSEIGGSSGGLGGPLGEANQLESRAVRSIADLPQLKAGENKALGNLISSPEPKR